MHLCKTKKEQQKQQYIILFAVKVCEWQLYASFHYVQAFETHSALQFNQDIFPNFIIVYYVGLCVFICCTLQHLSTDRQRSKGPIRVLYQHDLSSLLEYYRILIKIWHYVAHTLKEMPVCSMLNK